MHQFIYLPKSPLPIPPPSPQHPILLLPLRILQRPLTHKQLDRLLINLLPSRLEARDIVLQFLDTSRLELAREELTLLVRDLDGLELGVVFEEELQVLEGYVDVGVAAKGALFFGGGLAAREGVFVDLFLAGGVLVAFGSFYF